MGIKGDKMTGASQLSAEGLLDRLAIDQLSSKKMFGGHGIFHNGKMFGIVNSQGDIYFKVDDSNRARFEAAGAHQHGKMPYFSVPAAVLEDVEALTDWAQSAIAVAQRGK